MAGQQAGAEEFDDIHFESQEFVYGNRHAIVLNRAAETPRNINEQKKKMVLRKQSISDKIYHEERCKESKYSDRFDWSRVASQVLFSNFDNR